MTSPPGGSAESKVTCEHGFTRRHELRDDARQSDIFDWCPGPTAPTSAASVLCSVLQPEGGHKIHRNAGTRTACGISTAGMLSGCWPHQFPGATPDLLCRRGGCRG